MTLGRGPLVVVGDALLDVDVVGRADRLAPDAPVPVLEDVTETIRPGGAALAATLAAQDGHEVVLVAPLGDDEAADRLRALLDGLDDDVQLVPWPCAGETPVKRRIRAGDQSLARLDTGGRLNAIASLPPRGREALRRAGAVLVSDYGRGVTAETSVRVALSDLPRRVPVVWDPHPRGAEPVPAVRLATPNLVEAHAEDESLHSIAAAAATLVRRWQAQAVTVTLGARGALLSFGSGAPVVVPAPEVNCLDACGAGDRFASAAAVALAAGAVPSEAVQAAVQSASVFVAAGGAGTVRVGSTSAPLVAPSPERTDHGVAAQVRAAGGVVVATGGCFDILHAGHVSTLRAARRLGDCLVVCINSDASVRRLKGPGRPLVPAEDRIRVLEALSCVDAVVVFDEDTPAQVLQQVRPHVWAKGGDYAGNELPEEVALHQWGGQAVMLPYVEGRSTTRLVSAVATRNSDEQEQT